MELQPDEATEALIPKREGQEDLPPLSVRKHFSEADADKISPSRILYRRPLSGSLKHSAEATVITEASNNFTEALKTLFINTLPLIVVYFALFTVRNLSLHFIKDKNDNNLTSAIGIGNTLLNVVGLAVFMSLNAGLISQASKAFGAKNYQLMGFYMHRALVINTIGLIPGACLLFWADSLCILVGMDPEVARNVQKLTSACIIGVYAMMIYHTLSSYLYSCDIFFPSSFTLVTSSLTFSILCYLLFRYTDMNIQAIIISFNVMQCLNAVLIFLYIFVKNPVPGSFFWFKAQSFKGIWSLFVVEFHVGSMVFLEWISYEIIYLFAGKLTVTELGAVTIVFTNFQTLYAVPISLADTVLAFMGNAMGEGNIKKAKNFLKAGVMLSVISLVALELFYIFFMTQVSKFYTNDENIIQEAIKLFKIYLFYYPPDFIQIIFSAGLRAIGKEKLGSVTFFVCYYLIAIPLAYVLCFKTTLRDVGIVLGPMISIYILLIWLLIVYYFGINWEEQVKEIAEKLHKDHQEAMEDEIDIIIQPLKNRKMSL